METYLHVAAELLFDRGVEVEWSTVKGLQYGKEIALLNVYNAAFEDDYEKMDDSIIPITCFDDDETWNESGEIGRTSNDDWEDGAGRQKSVEKKNSCVIIDEAADFFVGELVQTAVEITSDAANLCGCSNQLTDLPSVVKEDTKNESTEESNIFSNVHPVNEDDNYHPIIDDDLFMTDILHAIAIEQEKVMRRNEVKEEKLSIVVTYIPRDAKKRRQR
jgi:hypothetical protein